MENQTIQVSLKRYEELILKEALLDKIAEGKDVAVYLFDGKEEKTNVKSGGFNGALNG